MVAEEGAKIEVADEGVSDLRKLQLVELSIMKAFAAFCEQENLRYCMIGGTLLGAVRHKGFIPWDDDVDLCMPRPDYERFPSWNLPPGRWRARASRWKACTPMTPTAMAWPR